MLTLVTRRGSCNGGGECEAPAAGITTSLFLFRFLPDISTLI